MSNKLSTSRRKLASRLGLVGLLMLAALAGRQVWPEATWMPLVWAQSSVAQPAMPPERLQSELIQAMQRELGGGAEEFKIVRSESAEWQDCLTGANQPNPRSDCQPTVQRGWRVQVSSQGETWVYYVTQAGDIQLDGPASLSPMANQALARQLGYSPDSALSIVAARPFGLMSACEASSPTQPCNARPVPHWQVLVAQQSRPLLITLQGNIVKLGSLRGFLPADLQGLDRNFAEAVLQDVGDRYLHALPPNFQVEQIQKTTWAICASDGMPAPGPGPSRPMMGACPVGTVSGWQMVARSGPVRWVYYVRPFPLTTWIGNLVDQVPPDGLQSLPASVAEAAIAATAQQEGRSIDSYRLQWVEARFFDACLNPEPNPYVDTVSPALMCRQGMQSGWRVQVLGPGENGQQRQWSYHTSLTGHEWRLISVQNWSPPPSAAPISTR
jgi:hypothetical protein